VRLLPGEFASEHWEFTARFDSGHLLFAEFLITNIGLGDRNAAAAGCVIEPNGKTHQFRNGRREGHWNLSSDRLRMEIGASLLDLHPPAYRLRVDKRGVRLDLSFRLDGPALWSDEFAPPGYALDLLDAAAPVEGTLWVKGMGAPSAVHGTIAVTRSWMNEAGSNLVLRRLEFFSLQENAALYAVDIATPDGARRQWMVVRQNGHTAYEFRQFELSLDGQTSESANQDYPEPAALRFKSRGIEGQVQLDRVLLRYDPLASLPQPFRFLVELALNLRPRRVWALSSFDFLFPLDPSAPDHGPLRIRGVGVTALTFLNPISPPRSKVALQTYEFFRARRCLDQPQLGS